MATPARLSSLSTSTLSQLLELTRTVQQLQLTPSRVLLASVARNLGQLQDGIASLPDDAGPVAQELSEQYDRLVGLAKGLGVETPRPLPPPASKLVDTETSSEDEDDFDGDDDSMVALQPLSIQPHTSPKRDTKITMEPYRDYDDDDDALQRTEEDEEELRRANQDVMRMQQQMMDNQDETLNSLSSAIQRQHHLSLHIADELTLHEELLEDTDAAVDRTADRLRRARGRLDTVASKARSSGGTGIIVALVVVLVILVVVFKT